MSRMGSWLSEALWH